MSITSFICGKLPLLYNGLKKTLLSRSVILRLRGGAKMVVQEEARNPVRTPAR